MSGWIKLHRTIIDSDIYFMPPLYLRVFERLILEANHQDNEIPYKAPGSTITTKKLIKRGEKLTSIRTICEWVGWYEFGIFKKPNPKTVKEILDWLVANQMIVIYPIQSNREGTHYKIVNYDIYQSKEDEEVTIKKQLGNSEETVTGSKQECNKNDKNDKEDIYSAFFEELWKLYPNKKGKSATTKKAKKELYKIGYEKMVQAINNYKQELEINTWKQPMNGSTFFNGRYVDYLAENYVKEASYGNSGTNDTASKKYDTSKFIAK